MALATLEQQDYDQLAKQVQIISETKQEDELFEIIGNALYDSGLDVSPANFIEATIPVAFDRTTLKFNILETIQFVENTEPITKEEAKKKGKKLLKRIKNELCSNEGVKDFFTGNSDLKDNLKVIIPLVLGLVSSTLTLGPIGLAIAVAVIALLLKVGYEAYCEI